MNLQDLLTGYVAHKLLSTTILIVVVLIIRKYVVHWIKSKETFLPTLKRQWIVRARLEQDITPHYLKRMGSADKGSPELNSC